MFGDLQTLRVGKLKPFDIGHCVSAATLANVTSLCVSHIGTVEGLPVKKCRLLTIEKLRDSSKHRQHSLL